MRPGEVSLAWACRGQHVLRDPDTGRWRFSPEKSLPSVMLEDVEAVNAATEAETNDGTTKTPFAETPASDNLLVHGDCFLAGLALEREFAGRVSLIYADPPFNTGNRYLAYEDNFSHPLWMSFMEDRLAVAKRLLRPGGVIAVHIGGAEQPYLRVLMDGAFGRDNLISQISWQRGPDRTLLGQGSSLVNDCVEYIVVYSNGPVRRDLDPPTKEVPLSWKTFRTYGRLLEFSPEKEIVCRFDSAGNLPVRIFRHKEYSLINVRPSELKQAFFTSPDRLKTIFPRMARFTNQQEESTFQQELLSHMPIRDTLYSAEYVQLRGKHKGPRVRYYLNNQVVLFLRDVSSLNQGSVVRTADLNNFWTAEELPATGIAKEGGVVLRRGKKPESLLYRIITAFSREGDIVLDPFAGSGTTGAVAHKTGRKWIMIDDSEKAIDQMTRRMKSVAGGTDLRGVTRLSGWAGGGGFRVARSRLLSSEE